MELEYSSGLNGASFLLFELKQVAKLKLLGFSNEEIRIKAKEENIFQFEHKGRINRILPSVLRRATVVDQTLASHMVEGPLESGKVINLYAIMKTDLFFYEFMNELISEKLKESNFLLEKKDINLFFTEKSEQSEIVANWSESNIKRLKSAMMLVLFESGLLKDRKTGQLQHVIIDEQIKDHLIQIGDARYVQAMGQ